jgi:hypothetical protein
MSISAAAAAAFAGAAVCVPTATAGITPNRTIAARVNIVEAKRVAFMGLLFHFLLQVVLLGRAAYRLLFSTWIAASICGGT